MRFISGIWDRLVVAVMVHDSCLHCQSYDPCRCPRNLPAREGQS